MAQVKEVSVGVTFTKNLGNYQSVKIDAGAVLTVEPTEDANEVFAKGWEMVGDQVEQQLALFDDNKKSGVKKGL